MKSGIKQKSIAIVVAALSVWSTQTLALSGGDGIFNCLVFSDNAAGTGTRYYLREQSSSGSSGTLTYTTDSTLATRFTFSRRDGWKNDTGGTSFFMTGGRYGGCIGLQSTVTPGIGTTVTTNWTCNEVTSKKIVVENTSVSTDFVMRVENSPGYWFDGWGGLVNGATIKLNTPQAGGAFGENQKFSTTGCRTSTNGTNRPRGGT